MADRIGQEERAMPSQSPPKQRPELSEDVVKFVRYFHSGRPGAHSYVLLLGLHDFDSASVLKSVQKGLSFKAFERFQRNAGFSQVQVSALVQIADRTLTRRREEGRLRPDESDR